MSTQTLADRYANEVVSEMITRFGYSVRDASRIVQKSEGKVRAWHRDGIPSRTAAKRLHLRGAAGRIDGDASFKKLVPSGCKYIPVEAFMVDADPSDLPPVDVCTAKAMAAPPQLAGFEGSDEPLKQNRVLSEVFGRPMKKEELEEAFSGVSRNGTPVMARVKSVYQPKNPLKGQSEVTVFCQLKAKGKEIGRMRRGFLRQANGLLFAYHSVVELDKEIRTSLGQGIGESITRNTLRWEKKIGIAAVDLHAAWVGRYVWASYGWQWNADEATQKWRELVEYVDERRDRYVLRGSSILHGEFDFGDDFKRFREHAKLLVVRPWDLASLHLAPRGNKPLVHVGKIFLAGIEIGSEYAPDEGGAEEWEGRLTLKDGHPTWERAKKKLQL